MSYQVSFLWKNDPQYQPTHYLFHTAQQAEAYGNHREAGCNSILAVKINSRPKMATHIFADGKVRTIHNSIDAWKTILEGDTPNGDSANVS